MGPSRAGKALLVSVVLVAALAVRIGYIEHTPYKAVNDAGTYNRLASLVARTGDYDVGNQPGTGAGGSRGPTAYFPPGFPYFLAAVDILTGHQAGHKPAIEPERIAQAVLGTVAVGLIGLVALEAFGGGAALASIVLGAFYPVLIELSGTLVAENLLIVFVLGAGWTALRARRARRPYAWIAATGVLTGAATLTHQNAFLLVLPLGFAAAAAARSAAPARASSPARGSRRPRPAAVLSVAILVATTVITIAPWTIRNAVELHRLIPVSDEAGITLVGTYNPDSAAFGPLAYKWRLFGKIKQDRELKRTAGLLTEPELGDRLQAQALSYIGDHPLSPVMVGWHNTLRLLELEGSYAWQASALAMGLRVDVARTGVTAFWVLGVLALAGTLTREARRAPRWLWAIPLLLALSVILINVETPRFREPIDPFVILLAGCAVSSVLRAIHARLRPAGRPAGGAERSRSPLGAR